MISVKISESHSRGGWPAVARRMESAANRWLHNAVTTPLLLRVLKEANEIIIDESRTWPALRGFEVRLFMPSFTIEKSEKEFVGHDMNGHTRLFKREVDEAVFGDGTRIATVDGVVKEIDYVMATRRLTLIAVNRAGIGYDIAALAAGDYNDR